MCALVSIPVLQRARLIAVPLGGFAFKECSTLLHQNGVLRMWVITDTGPREAVGGTGKRTPMPEIAEDDVYHGHAPLGAAAAHRGLARCLTQPGSAKLQRAVILQTLASMPA